MTSTLPIPVRFELPGPEWEPIDPEANGVPNAAFLAVRRGTPGDYTPTLSVSGGWRNDGSTLEQIADESLEVLRAQGASDVELVKRRVIDSETAPAVTQSMGAVVQVDGRSYDLRQAQAVQGMVDVEDPAKRVVVLYTFTSTFAQFDEYGPEFQRFMASVEVVPARA
jgi:hypothetical protein